FFFFFILKANFTKNNIWLLVSPKKYILIFFLPQIGKKVIFSDFFQFKIFDAQKVEGPIKSISNNPQFDMKLQIIAHINILLYLECFLDLNVKRNKIQLTI
ncbi:unnamed protein product, partial [Meganyctiphanes norvegica]